MPMSFGAGGKSTPKRKSRLPSTLPTNGLLVYLDAANPNSYPGAGSTWFDLSGNNLHATLYNGAAQNKNVAGGVMQFSSGNTGTPSTADYILTQVPNLSSTNYTVIAASRYTILSGDSTQGRGRIVSGANNNWLMGHWSGTQEAYHPVGWVSAQNTSSAGAKWRIYAATGDITNDSYALYVNNTQTSSGNGGSGGPNGIILGKGGSGHSYTWQEPSKGQIAFLLVWNRVLTTQELTDVYNLFKDRFIVADSNLKLHIDAADSASYSGSGTAVSDISGNGLNCTLTNGPTFSNNSFRLDGVNDVILTSSNVDLRSDFTLECWALTERDQTATGASPQFSLFGQGSATNNAGLHVMIVPNSARGQLFGLYYNDASKTTVGTIYQPNTWYHFAVTYSHSSPYPKKMYVNGVDIGIVAEQTQGAYAAAAGILRIGDIFAGSGVAPTKGRIAQARYYNKVLTASEVLQNYNATKMIFYPTDFPANISNLEVWLKSDSGVYDSSSNLITTDNTSAPAWEDKSGNNRSVVNTNATYQPALRTGANGINNLPALSFDGVNDKLVGTWSGYNTSKPYTIFHVVNYTTFGDGIIYAYSLNNTTGAEGDAVRFLNSGGRKLLICSNAIVDTGDLSGPLPPSGTLLLTFQHSGASGAVGTFTIRANGQQVYQNTSVTRSSTVVGNTFALGALTNSDATPTSPFAGKVCEHLYFSKVLNDKEIKMVEAYLNAKWDCYKFNPSDISNLALWVDADDASTLYQSSGGSLAAADGDVVGAWLDKSGNGRHMTQATAANKPVLKKNQINGKQVVRGDGVNDRLQQLAVAPNYIVNSTFTVFAVLNSRSAFGRAFGNTNGTVGNNGFNVRSAVANEGNKYWVVRNAAGTVGDVAMTGTISLNQTYLYTFRLNASGAQTFLNGFQNTATTNVTDLGTPTVPFTLFQDGTPDATLAASNVDIAELIVYSKSLTDQERISIENYLRRKWGI